MNFDTVPDNAVGIYSVNNDNPLENRFNVSPTRSYSIEEKSYDRMTLKRRSTEPIAGTIYLGGIISPDGSVVYWVNNTKPLP